MKADILTLKSLFQKDVRYIIPAFQRPYVWTQDDQWEPLWNDVRNAAEGYLDELQQAMDRIERLPRAVPRSTFWAPSYSSSVRRRLRSSRRGMSSTVSSG